MGGARGRVQLPGLAQLGDGLAGGLRDGPPRGRQRVRLGRRRSTARTGCSGGSSCAFVPAARSSSRRRRSTTAATCATASTGGRRPRFAPTATRTSSTRWSSPPPTTSPTSTPGRWTPRASTSATRATTSPASCRASSTAAASRSWASTTPRTESGMVHVADHHDMPGKKIWSWGWDDEGKDWRRALSDDQSAYLEVQAGLFRNQETYAFLEPQQLLRFRETYQPVRKIGGYSRANDEGVVHVRRGERQRCGSGLNVTRAVRGGRVVVRDGAATVREEAFEPRRPPAPSSASSPTSRRPGPYTVEVRDGTGRVLLAHTEGRYDFVPKAEVKTGPQAAHVFPPPEKRTRGRLGGARPPPGAEREAARGPRRLRGGARGVSREPGAPAGRGTPRCPAQALRRGGRPAVDGGRAQEQRRRGALLPRPRPRRSRRDAEGPLRLGPGGDAPGLARPVAAAARPPRRPRGVRS